MEWHISDAQSLSIIDREIGRHSLTPAEYELVRRVIYATADFDYKTLIRMSETALQSGAAALAARTTIIVYKNRTHFIVFSLSSDFLIGIGHV